MRRRSSINSRNHARARSSRPTTGVPRKAASKGACGEPRCLRASWPSLRIGGRVGLVDSAREKNKASDPYSLEPGVITRLAPFLIPLSDKSANRQTDKLNQLDRHFRSFPCVRVCALAHTSSLDTDLTHNTRAPHFTPQHWLLCHMGLH